MDKNYSKTHLPKESNYLSHGESLPNQEKQTCKKSLEYLIVDPLSKKTPSLQARYNYPLHQASNYFSKAECLARLLRQRNDHSNSHEYPATDLSQKECDAMRTEYDGAEIQKNYSKISSFGEIVTSDMQISTAKLKIENLKEGDHQCDKKTLIGTKSSEKKVVNYLQGNNPSINTGSTSETQDIGDDRHAVNEKVEDAPEDKAAKALELEYMNKYAAEYSKELVFAIDVMTLVRHLNNLEFRYIIYNAKGNLPVSPCDDILDEALMKMWELIQNIHVKEFESEMKKKQINYQLFQKIVINMAEKEELKDYNEESFLAHCLLLAQSAVFAEKYGVPDALNFIPLIICRTLQNLKDSGKLLSNFWEKISEKAVYINRILTL